MMLNNRIGQESSMPPLIQFLQGKGPPPMIGARVWQWIRFFRSLEGDAQLVKRDTRQAELDRLLAKEEIEKLVHKEATRNKTPKGEG